MKRARTKQPGQTPHMRLEKIIEWCQAIDTGAAREIAQAAHRLMQTCDMPATERQKEIRKMCGAWNVDRGGGKKRRTPPLCTQTRVASKAGQGREQTPLGQRAKHIFPGKSSRRTPILLLHGIPSMGSLPALPKSGGHFPHITDFTGTAVQRMLAAACTLD